MTTEKREVSQDFYDLQTPEARQLLTVRQETPTTIHEPSQKQGMAGEKRGTNPKPETEADFAGWLEQLLNLHGWQWVHIRGAWSKDSERFMTPVSGPGGKGLPDYHIWHEDKRLSFWVELKAQRGTLSGEQKARIESLQKAGEVVFVFRPSDRAEIQTLLE